MADVKPNGYIMGRIEERWIVGKWDQKKEFGIGKGRREFVKEKRDGPFEMTGWTSLCRPSLSIGLIAIANAMHFKRKYILMYLTP